MTLVIAAPVAATAALPHTAPAVAAPADWLPLHLRIRMRFSQSIQPAQRSNRRGAKAQKRKGFLGYGLLVICRSEPWVIGG